MMRMVVDTDVMVAALQSDQGASRALLEALFRGEAAMLLSTSLMVEYEAVLTRPKILERAGIAVAELIALLDDVARICIPVQIDYRWRPASCDPNDDHILETAINGSANVIATFNLRHLAKSAAKFNISAARPVAILNKLRLENAASTGEQ
jgi:putative PIN family toxin of toxin-antitoxin system